MIRAMARAGRARKRSKRKELLLLLSLHLAGPIGRYRLKEILGLDEHEGVVKLMLQELRRSRLVSASKQGCQLSEAGRRYLKERLREYGIRKFSWVDLGPLQKGDEAFCVQVAKCAQRVASGMEQRDIAVKGGADAALIITVKGGALTIPPDYNLSTGSPSVAARLRKEFAPASDDVLIVGFSSDRWRAVEGALAASMSLCGPWE